MFRSVLPNVVKKVIITCQKLRKNAGWSQGWENYICVILISSFLQPNNQFPLLLTFKTNAEKKQKAASEC